VKKFVIIINDDMLTFKKEDCKMLCNGNNMYRKNVREVSNAFISFAIVKFTNGILLIFIHPHKRNLLFIEEEKNNESFIKFWG